jgi:leucyl-tRNA synthetase
MEYDFRKIEQEWQEKWKENKTYKVSNTSDKPKFYVLDMFPYPSGAGLHVGHPLGYIASDIYSRYKRLKGFNVLHPMGFDSFGLPAEQYALETGQHPAETTKKNIATFKEQMDKIGFCYDWDREVRTSDPKYYKWTQWLFLQLFNSYFCNTQQKARPIADLIKKYETKGSKHFTAEEWNAYSKKEQEDILMQRRLAFSSYGEVNWCEALGTVLANDEVVNGVSERGGHPVVKKKMRQWYMRITSYADRLLQGLETVNFSDAMKEMQRNWIGKSEGAEMEFALIPGPSPQGEKGVAEMEMENEAKGAALVPKYKVSSPIQFDLAKENRKGHTEAENLLWQELRNNKLGVKFRRQHPIDAYIVDFICLQQRLIVEVDGGYHETDEQKELDKERTRILNEIGFNVIRFTNEGVINDIESTVQTIKGILIPVPSPREANEKEPENAETHSNKETIKGNEFSHPSPLVEKGMGVRVYTTRPDTIFGVDFLVLAPEHELVNTITTDEQRKSIDEYLTYVKSRSDRERMAEVKQITGCFTGAYAVNPFDGKQIPVWIAEYVLAGYGTGAIMAVPCGDQRDFAFAKHFNIPITNIIGNHFNGEEANPTKDAVLENSGFLNGLLMKDAIAVAINKIEELGIGKRKVNYKMRDAGFSRQRYWGEPFPIKWIDGIAVPLDESELPLELPHVDKYGPGPEGEGPLANIKDWVELAPNMRRETSTMPGYAGSSWYFLRYMDPHNDETFCDRKVSDYWNQVDVYIGGTEHAVGHLLYSRMWTKVMYDLGLIGFDEPFKKLVNQGMITGSSRFIYYFELTGETKKDNRHYISPGFMLSYDLISDYVNGQDTPKDFFERLIARSDKLKEISELVNFTGAMNNRRRVNVNLVDGVLLNIEKLKEEKTEFGLIEFIGNTNGDFVCEVEVEKMSKSKYNTVDPRDLVLKYGADTFRMYEMFLGPVEMSKPWDTKGIEGVHRFLRKLWRLFYDDIKGKVWNEEKATDAELKVLHRTIKKIEEDTERFSFNTAVSTFMICVNELADLKCNKKEILQPLLILLAPYAPHIAEHLYNELNFEDVPHIGEDVGVACAPSILDAEYPAFNGKYLVESSKEYPVSINGKVRTNIEMALDLSQDDVEKTVLQNETVQKWLEGKAPKKIIYVKNKMVNVVV